MLNSDEIKLQIFNPIRIILLVLIIAVAEPLHRDLSRVSEWCDLWGMKLNASKTKTTIVSWPRTMRNQSPPLTVGGTVLKKFIDRDVFHFE